MCSTRLATKIVVKMLTGRSREWLLYIIIFAFSSRLISVCRPLLGTGPLMINSTGECPFFWPPPRSLAPNPPPPPPNGPLYRHCAFGGLWPVACIGQGCH